MQDVAASDEKVPDEQASQVLVPVFARVPARHFVQDADPALDTHPDAQASHTFVTVLACVPAPH